MKTKYLKASINLSLFLHDRKYIYNAFYDPALIWGPLGLSLQENRLHSFLIDSDLTLKTKDIETNLLKEAMKHRPDGNMSTWGPALHEGQQTWVGLDPQVLSTTYSELLEIFHRLPIKKNDLLVDLGAGYGRAGLVLKKFYPEAKYWGVEYVAQRVEEGSRIFKKYHCLQATLIHGDLTDDKLQIPEAKFYFLYDFGHTHAIAELLKKIQSFKHQFFVIARGYGSRSIIDQEHPWLSQVFKPYHNENFSLYSNFTSLS
jgi:hypothetical protein